MASAVCVTQVLAHEEGCFGKVLFGKSQRALCRKFRKRAGWHRLLRAAGGLLPSCRLQEIDMGFHRHPAYQEWILEGEARGCSYW